MNIYYDLSEFNRLDNAVVTIGTFDGVHEGHKKLIKHLIDIAKKRNGESVLITFWPHPRIVLNKSNDEVKLLSTLDEKIKLLSEFKLDHTLVIPFTTELSKLTAEEFVNEVLINKIGTKTFVIGHDHKFGRNREGDINFLKINKDKFKIEVEEINPKDIENINISSTLIREALLNSDIYKANMYLGREYSLSGNVEESKQNAKYNDFSTLNILVDKYKLVPSSGLYIVKLKFDCSGYFGLLNINSHTTFNETERTVEVRILDFNKDIYGKKIEISFIGHIGNEKNLKV